MEEEMVMHELTGKVIEKSIYIGDVIGVVDFFQCFLETGGIKGVIRYFCGGENGLWESFQDGEFGRGTSIFPSQIS
jgi:hypothetical protein